MKWTNNHQGYVNSCSATYGKAVLEKNKRCDHENFLFRTLENVVTHHRTFYESEENATVRRLFRLSRRILRHYKKFLDRDNQYRMSTEKAKAESELWKQTADSSVEDTLRNYIRISDILLGYQEPTVL